MGIESRMPCIGFICLICVLWYYCDCRALAPDIVAEEGVASTPGPGSGLAFRGRQAISDSWEHNQQVAAVQWALVEVLGPSEPLLSQVQGALEWEQLDWSPLLCLGLNAAFW